MKTEMWDVRVSRAVSLAEAFRTDWSRERQTPFGRPTNRELFSLHYY